MFVYNVKINGSKTFKTIFMGILILLLIVVGVVGWKVFAGSSKSYGNSKNISEIQTKNYTNILKAVHENIDKYVGIEFKFTGYIYRVSDNSGNHPLYPFFSPPARCPSRPRHTPSLWR